MSFALTAFVMIFLHLAPTMAGMGWSIYQQNGIHLMKSKHASANPIVKTARPNKSLHSSSITLAAPRMTKAGKPAVTSTKSPSRSGGK